MLRSKNTFAEMTPEVQHELAETSVRKATENYANTIFENGKADVFNPIQVNRIAMEAGDVFPSA